jgi:spermidine/putrescine transport system permease protein
MLIGVQTAWFIATRPTSQKSLRLMLVTVPYWMNLLVRTIALLLILPLYAAIERFDFSLLETVNDLHANRRRAFFAVVLPILRSGLIAGGLLVLISGIGSDLAPDILGGGKTLMLGNLIGMQFQGSRNWPIGAALSTVLMAVTLIALFITARRVAQVE